jgi:ATP-dependent HslUV protease ATP-binding subunit HslU
VLERLLEEISFEASDKSGSAVMVDVDLVKERVGVLAKNADLSKFIL